MKYYFTFLCDDGPNDGKFHIEEGTYEEAREKMIEKFGTNWGFQYDEDEWIIKKSRNPKMFISSCIIQGLNPDEYDELTQAELFGLKEI